MTGKKQAAFLSYGKSLLMWILILLCYFQGIRAWLRLEAGDALTIFLSSSYPSMEQAREIMEQEQEMEKPADVCFYWDGGLQKAWQKEYERQTEVLFIGLYGNEALFDWRLGGFSQEDEKGCVIDKETAMELFGSTEAEGSSLRVENSTYTVRKVIDGEQRIVIVPAQKKETVFTRLFVGAGKENRQGVTEQFLMRHGLTGCIVNDSAPRILALFMLVLLPVVLAVQLFLMTRRERKACRGNMGALIGWLAAELFLIGILFFFLWKNVQLPKDWIPGKWSDFEFWSRRLHEMREGIKWYLMLPKTVIQMEQIITAAKAAGYAFAALVFYLFGHVRR